MAKQAGIMRLSGPLGNLSFYEMKGGYYVRAQTHHAVATDPRFKKTHLMGLDFGTASRASKLLRTALSPAIRSFSDEHIASRLSGHFVTVVHADTRHDIGQRKVLVPNLHLLKGFEFNRDRALDTSRLSVTTSVNRVSGEVKLSLSTSSRKLASIELVAAIACVNFETGIYTRHTPTTFIIGHTRRAELILQACLNTDPNAVIIITLGVSSNGSGQPGAMAIIAVHTPPVSAPVDKRIKRAVGIHRSGYRSRRPYSRTLRKACYTRARTFPRPRESAITHKPG